MRLPFAHINMAARLIGCSPVLLVASPTQGGRESRPYTFAILTATLPGHFLPAWHPGFKMRESARPKFFWFDPGVARAAAGWLRDPVDRAWQGLALETLIYHEMRVFNETIPATRNHHTINWMI